MVDIRTNTEAMFSRATAHLDQVLDYPLDLIGAFVSLPERGLSGLKQDLLKPFTLRDLRRRLIITATDMDDEASERQVICNDVQEYLDQSDWHMLADYIGHLDRTRNSTPSGLRHLEIATTYLRATLATDVQAPDASNYLASYNQSEATLRDLRKASDADPDNYTLAALLALLHLDCGWFARGSGWANAVGESGWAAMNTHYHIARDVITRFDPIAYGSPLLAEIQYRLCVGLENGRDRLAASFLDWVDLDPTNLTVYRQHAYHCLPRWYGDYKILEQQARLAAETSHDALGDGAYSVMMMHAMRFEDGAAHYLKPERFVDGLNDLLTHFESEPYRVTATFSEMLDSLQPHYHHLLGAKRAKKRVSRQVTARIAPVIRTHLKLFCSVAWSQKEDQFLTLAARGYQQDLKNGATVTVGQNGVRRLQVSEIK